MTYDIFSSHAPTGESANRVVSPNPYTTQGRTIGFPSNLDSYVRLLSDGDGSQTVQENRTVADLVGSRLYLYHRPLVNTNGTATTVTSSQGTIDSTFTSPSQAYIVFSSLPTSNFTVSYVASPDCDFTWSINTLQDSVMEIEKVLGPTNNTGYAGIRNLKVGIFDSPLDAVASGVLQNAVALSDLDRNIVLGSSSNPTLQALRGTNHTVQLGRTTDNVVIDATGFSITQSNGALVNKISLGTKTGDSIVWKGTASGAGPLTLGGPEWPIYSGTIFSVALTGSFYSGSMLKVHGDASFMGNIKAVGNVTIVNVTGSTSTVLGDWTVRDELFVDGQSHLNGAVDTNQLTVNQNLRIAQDITALNINGSGGAGQSLVDNLDCSEVAWSYSTVIKSKHSNSVISAPINTGAALPKKTSVRPWMSIGPNNLVGDVFAITGQLNAAASSSGAHPHILQLLMGTQMVSGTYNASGYLSGTWSPGMMEPGNMWIRMLDGPAQNMNAPIYGYTVEGTTGLHVLNRLNVFIPETVAAPPQTNNKYLLYNPGSVAYRTLTAAGGASPTFAVNASTTEPLAISFEDSVRILNSNTVNFSLNSALLSSVTGLGGFPVTGIAYVFADSVNTDPEGSPLFKARAVPMRMPGQTSIGEVVASYDGATWTILDTISYRPNGLYDSSWIPIIPQNGVLTSGRCTPGFTSASSGPMRVYFHHYLGSDVDIGNISADLYLGNLNTGTNIWNRTHTPMYSFFGQDSRNSHGLSGSFFHVPLGAKRTTSAISDRDASIFYLDSALIGVDISPALVNGFPITGAILGGTPSYLRLIVNKNT